MMESADELSFLNCYICFESLKKPKICPSCNKVACEKCLRSWVEEKRSECPHCRQIMPLSSFAECQRFISDIKHLVKAVDQNSKNKQKCPEHYIEMTYYCEECNEAICSDCGMFGSKHKGHKISHLKKIYQTYKNKILNQLTQYDQKIQSYRQNGREILSQQQKLAAQAQQRKNFIQEYFIAIIQRIEEEFKAKQDKIANKYDCNAKQIEFLESFRENIYRELQSSSENQLINKCDELVGYVQSIFQRRVDYQYEEHVFEAMNQIVPKYHQFRYILPNYEALDQSIIYSEPYKSNGIEWRLKIYPKGNGQARNSFLSIFLEMSDGFTSGNKYQYKIELINQYSQRDSVIRQYSSNFDIGQCWGYNQFVMLDGLSEFVTESGDLVFKVSIRNPSYRSLVRDQHQYIRSLEQKIASINHVSSNRELVKNPSKRSINPKTQTTINSNNKALEQAQLISREAKEKMKKLLMSADDDNSEISHHNRQDQLNSEFDEQLPNLLKILTNDKGEKYQRLFTSRQKVEMKEEQYSKDYEHKKQGQLKRKQINSRPKFRKQQRMGQGNGGNSERQRRQFQKQEIQSVGSLSLFDPQINERVMDYRGQLEGQNSCLSDSIQIDSSSSYPHFQ